MIGVEVNKVAVLEVANEIAGSASQSLGTSRSSYYCSGHTTNIDPLCHHRLDGALRRVARSSRPLNRCVD